MSEDTAVVIRGSRVLGSLGALLAENVGPLNFWTAVLFGGAVAASCRIVRGADDGATTQASDDGSTLPDKDVVSCVVAAFRGLSYLPGSGQITVVYPIALAP